MWLFEDIKVSAWLVPFAYLIGLFLGVMLW